MIDLPLNAEVHCSDGVAGRSTYVIGNPMVRQVTHLVVKSFRPPFLEYLVPIILVDENTPDRIKLKCTRSDLIRMEPFEYETYIKTEVPGVLLWPYDLPDPITFKNEVETYKRVKRQKIPEGGIAVRRGARVKATDGYVGQVDELLVDSNTMQVTHLVLLEGHVFKQREITIPVSQIERVGKTTVYLKLDRQSIEAQATTPEQRWPV
jgi:sporulation protein YlmC with PRC-barrel domain